MIRLCRSMALVTLLGVVSNHNTNFAHAYDREAAVLYARKWGQGSGANILICNTTIYGQRYPSDCANFASQCLIAGGIRFRVKKDNPLDNTENYPPLETWESFADGPGVPAGNTPLGETPLFSARTYPITSTDMTRYSRTVPAAEHLGHVSLPKVHGGKLYGPFNTSIDHNDAVWYDVKPGDCLFQIGANDTFKHAMFISTVIDSPFQREIKYSAHSNDHVDKSLNVALAENVTLPGETPTPFYIVCLPDAPRTVGVTMWSGNNRFFTSGKRLFAATGQKAVVGPDEDLIIRIQFDSVMDTSKVPSVSFHDEQHSAYLTDTLAGVLKMTATFKPGDSYNALGWSPDGRRWRGIVRKENLPKNMNTDLRIRVSAQAEDGGTLDVNNHLRGYEPSNLPVLAGIVRVDTRKSASKKE